MMPLAPHDAGVHHNLFVRQAMPFKELFPPIEPYAAGFLPVDNLHTLYWEESGNPNGTPVIFLHGGPGAGSNPRHRSYFDPSAWRIIMFDQRGCGQSTPCFETRQNTRALLVEDVESIRRFRGLDRCHIFGGSWGSTLALSYAVAYPERCLSLTLRGIFLLTQAEVDWFMDGIGLFFPEARRELEEAAGYKSGDQLLDLCYALMCGDNPTRRDRVMMAWSRYETACSTLLPPDDIASKVLPIALLEAHFLKNEVIPDSESLLHQVDKIRKIPCTIIQGRYDCVCPIATADALHRAWPEAIYQIIPDAGHSMNEPGIRSALIEATERYKTITLP